jgi:hypothetical protein
MREKARNIPMKKIRSKESRRSIVIVSLQRTRECEIYLTLYVILTVTLGECELVHKLILLNPDAQITFVISQQDLSR